MSLVEQALKKIQSSGAKVPAPLSVTPPPAAPVQRSAAEVRKPAEPVQRSSSSNRTVIVDRVGLHVAGVLPPPSDERVLAQEFRQIKRPLIAAALGRGREALPNGQLIMLASALPGDGKTFTSVNLALSMALEKDLRVLLVDADVAKPHISRIFGLDSDAGLLDVLRDENADVESHILPTDIAGLSLLSAGRPSETATELLASSRMETVVAQLAAADPGRIVLFDSPPLLLTTESRALSATMGQIVLVVSAGITPQTAVFEALELLGDGRNVSLVLNRSDEASRSGYHDYYSQSPGQPGPGSSA